MYVYVIYHQLQFQETLSLGIQSLCAVNKGLSCETTSPHNHMIVMFYSNSSLVAMAINSFGSTK